MPKSVHPRGARAVPVLPVSQTPYGVSCTGDSAAGLHVWAGVQYLRGRPVLGVPSVTRKHVVMSGLGWSCWGSRKVLSVAGVLSASTGRVTSSSASVIGHGIWVSTLW